MAAKVIQLSIRFTQEQHERLEKLKKRDGPSIQHSVTRAVGEYLKKKGV